MLRSQNPQAFADAGDLLDPEFEDLSDLAEQPWERELSIHDALTEAQASAWRTRWPNHCTACGGWGGSSFRQGHPYGSTTAYESLFDPCERGDITLCHRCGYEGMSADDGSGPCFWCGWEQDDGVPSVM